MLRWRLVSAAVLISALLGLLWLDYHQVVFGRPGFWLLAPALALLGLAVLELGDLLEAQDLRPRMDVTLAGTLLVVVAAGVPAFLGGTSQPRPELPFLATAFGVMLAFLGEMARYREPGRVTLRVATSVLTITYIGLLGSFLVMLRLFHDNAWGLVALVSVIIGVKMSDTGAYFTGRLIGRHKMSPVLSPKKTIEGAIGGIVATIGSLALYFTYIVPRLIPDASPPDWWRCGAYGLALAIAGMIGDLAESLVKRDMGQKDASRRLPGMGGVLDVLDSLLFGAPVAYACFSLGLIGPLSFTAPQ